MEDERSFRRQMAECLPGLRRYALFLTRNATDADDLVQEAIKTALANESDYDHSRPLSRWMSKILRNCFNKDARSRRVRQAKYQAVADVSSEAIPPEQPGRIELLEVLGAISKLPEEQQSALFLVSCEGRSYSEAAYILGVEVGTVKSRVSRARSEIVQMLERDGKVSAIRQ